MMQSTFGIQRRSGADWAWRGIRQIAELIMDFTMWDFAAYWRGIDHAVKVGGVDSVGIGTDFDGVACTPPDLDEYDKFPALTRDLLEKGYSANDVSKIMGVTC